MTNYIPYLAAVDYFVLRLYHCLFQLAAQFFTFIISVISVYLLDYASN